MKLIDDIDKFWKFWSVRFGLLATACGSGMAAWAGAHAIDPSFTADFPRWAIDGLSFGSVGFSVAALIARGVKQPSLEANDGGQ